MARYLVTGGCGFIGSHLTDALIEQGHEVRILDDLSTGRRDNVPPTAEIMVGDVADQSVVRHAVQGVDGVFHLAAIASVARSNEDWVGTHVTNLTGCINVFDAARFVRQGDRIPVVYASSAAIYGANTSVPLAEDTVPGPMTAYGADKLGCELHARVATTIHGVPTTGLRFFNVYGPRQDPRSPYSGVISIFCERLRAKQPITVFGDGEQVRDFIYVADVVRFLVRAMMSRSGEPEVFNICTGTGTSVLHLAKTIAELCGLAAEVQFAAARQGDVRLSVGDPGRAGRRFGLQAETALREGLKHTLASQPLQHDPLRLRYG